MDQPKYRIEIFWSDEDRGYIANVPDLEYCSAFGETYQEALREVLVAMELHLETLQELNRQIPEPTSHQEQGMVVRTGDYVLEYRTDEVAGSAGQEAREAVIHGHVSLGGFPIPNYDELNVAEVSKVLDALTAAEIRKVREYEKRNKSRETLIEQLDRRLGD